MPARPERKPYRKPEIKTYEGQPVGRKRKTKKYGEFFYSRDIDQKKYLLCQKLKGKGIPVEEAVQIEKIKGEKKIHVLFKAHGIEVDSLREEQILELLPSIARIIGDIHVQQMIHGHPHLGNFFFHEKKGLKIGDFAFIKQVKVDWRDIDSILDSFETDYEFIFFEDYKKNIFFREGKPRFGRENKNFISQFIENMVGAYPLSKEEKDKLSSVLKELYL